MGTTQSFLATEDIAHLQQSTHCKKGTLLCAYPTSFDKGTRGPLPAV